MLFDINERYNIFFLQEYSTTLIFIIKFVLFKKKNLIYDSVYKYMYFLWLLS